MRLFRLYNVHRLKNFVNHLKEEKYHARSSWHTALNYEFKNFLRYYQLVCGEIV